VDFAGGRLEDPGAAAARVMQQVQRTVGAGPDGLFGIALVVLRRRAACEVENPVRLDGGRLDDVVFPEREMTAVVQGGEVAGVATRKIVDRGHAEPVVQQLRAQMAAEKPGSAGHDSPLSIADVRSPLRGIHSGSSLITILAPPWVANCMPPRRERSGWMSVAGTRHDSPRFFWPKRASAGTRTGRATPRPPRPTGNRLPAGM